MCFMSYADTVETRFAFGKVVFWPPLNHFRTNKSSPGLQIDYCYCEVYSSYKLNCAEMPWLPI